MSSNFTIPPLRLPPAHIGNNEEAAAKPNRKRSSPSLPEFQQRKVARIANERIPQDPSNLYSESDNEIKEEAEWSPPSPITPLRPKALNSSLFQEVASSSPAESLGYHTPPRSAAAASSSPAESLGYHTPPRSQENDLGNGENHTVVEGKTREDGRKTIIKVVKCLGDPKKRRLTNRQTINAYFDLLENRVPVAEIFSVPDDNNPRNKTNTIRGLKKDGIGFVCERVSFPAPKNEWANNHAQFQNLSPRAQAFLNMAKKWLNDSINARKILIGDFKPDNVMMSDEGEIKVVDYASNRSAILNGDRDNLFHFFEEFNLSLSEWSCGNENIKQWLMADFSQSFKETYGDYLNQ